MKPTIDYTLYLVTDRDLMNSPTIEESVRQAVLGGCTLVQLREKTASSRDFYETAWSLRHITAHMGVPLIINDRVDIALAVGADGVHIGQNDLPAAVVRKIIGPDKIVGISASNLRQAKAAVDAGADYLGIGAMYATGTKMDANLTSLEELRKIRQAIRVPIVVIGGINEATIPSFHGTGVDGLAVVSAIVSQPDVAEAARKLKALFLNEGATA